MQPVPFSTSAHPWGWNRLWDKGRDEHTQAVRKHVLAAARPSLGERALFFSFWLVLVSTKDV